MSAGSLAYPSDPAPEDAAVDREVDGQSSAARKWQATALSMVMLVMVASPVFENWEAAPRDDFPLSYYPMFSENPSDRQRVHYLIGFDAEGNRHLLPYHYAGRGGMNQVRRQMNRLVSAGEASELCRDVAERVARAGSRLRKIGQVAVVTGTFRLSAYFTGRATPDAEQVRAQCAVRRG
jgi:hypothetical protein